MVPAGPRGPSQVVATDRPLRKVRNIERAPDKDRRESEPRAKSMAPPDRTPTRKSPSRLAETRLVTGRLRNQAPAANTSRCQTQYTTGSPDTGTWIRQRRLSNQRRTNHVAIVRAVFMWRKR